MKLAGHPSPGLAWVRRPTMYVGHASGTPVEEPRPSASGSRLSGLGAPGDPGIARGLHPRRPAERVWATLDDQHGVQSRGGADCEGARAAAWWIDLRGSVRDLRSRQDPPSD